MRRTPASAVRRRFACSDRRAEMRSARLLRSPSPREAREGVSRACSRVSIRGPASRSALRASPPAERDEGSPLRASASRLRSAARAERRTPPTPACSVNHEEAVMVVNVVVNAFRDGTPRKSAKPNVDRQRESFVVRAVRRYTSKPTRRWRIFCEVSGRSWKRGVTDRYTNFPERAGWRWRGLHCHKRSRRKMFRSELLPPRVHETMPVSRQKPLLETHTYLFVIHGPVEPVFRGKCRWRLLAR
jgi:hypothetical protein